MDTASNPLSRRVIVAVTDNIATAYRYGDMSEQEVTDRIYDSGSVVCGVVVKTQGPRSLNIFTRVEKDDPYRRRVNLEKFVDDTGGGTLAAASTLSPDLKGTLESDGKTGAAKKVGALIAKMCLERKVEKVVFDRNGFLYHGRIKALAEAAREAGLSF